jgi:hypothetical protein
MQDVVGISSDLLPDVSLFQTALRLTHTPLILFQISSFLSRHNDNKFMRRLRFATHSINFIIVKHRASPRKKIN